MEKITYIWHDCFVVETESVNLVFDYWLDKDGTRSDRPAFLNGLDCNRPLYVFVSHFHKDHYNPAIFSWASRFEKIHYIVSIDVWKRMKFLTSATSVYKGPRVDTRLVSVLKPGDCLGTGDLKIFAFPSTDIGNAYLAEVQGTRFFHAGDLNAWVWRDESTPEEIKKSLDDYHRCLDKIEFWLDSHPHHDNSEIDFDYCFFPVDSRIGSGYWEGASIFVRSFFVARFFPMHFALGDDRERKQHIDDALRLELYANLTRGEYISLVGSGAKYINGK